MADQYFDVKVSPQYLKDFFANVEEIEEPRVIGELVRLLFSDLYLLN